MVNPRNVEWVVENELCIGCGVCEAACSRRAIKMTYNDGEGMIFPTISEETCNGCGTCLEVCYGFGVDHELNLRIFHSSSNSILANHIGCYTGFAADHVLRSNSTSGGLVTALLMHALEERLIDGAIVTRMEGGNPPKAKAIIATTTEEMVSCAGSKYCPVSLATCLESVENDKRYAVVGLPCHIYSVRKLAEYSSEIRDSIRLYLGILCGGMPSYLGTQYVFRVHNVESHSIKRLEYRGGGWPGRLLVQSEYQGQEKEISISYPEYWQGAFGYFLPYRCKVCHDGFNEFSDISCGDAWLPQIMKKDREGTSLIITRTENGERLVRDALQKGGIQITRIGDQDALRSQQGLVQFKNLTLESRIRLSKIIQKKLPNIDLSRTAATDFMSFLAAMELYAGSMMASRRNLWRLLDTYISSRRTIGRAIGALKSHVA